jgi:hypothetical protein
MTMTTAMLKIGTKHWKESYRSLEVQHGELRKAVVEYLSELDNPVPDALLRRSLRERLRKLTQQNGGR